MDGFVVYLECVECGNVQPLDLHTIEGAIEPACNECGAAMKMPGDE